MPIRSRYLVPHIRASHSFRALLGWTTSARFGSGVGGEAFGVVAPGGGTRTLFESGLGSDLGGGFFCSFLGTTGSTFGMSRRVSSGGGSGAGRAFSKVGVCADSTWGTGCCGTGRAG